MAQKNIRTIPQDIKNKKEVEAIYTFIVKEILSTRKPFVSWKKVEDNADKVLNIPKAKKLIYSYVDPYTEGLYNDADNKGLIKTIFYEVKIGNAYLFYPKLIMDHLKESLKSNKK